MSHPDMRIALAPDLTALTRLAADLRACADEESVLTLLATNLRQRFTAAVSLFTRSELGGPLVGVAFDAAETPSEKVAAGADSLVANADAIGGACRTNGRHSAYRPVACGLPQSKIHTALALPLPAESGPERVLQLLRAAEPPFSDEDMRWCEAAAALAGARLYAVALTAEIDGFAAAQEAALEEAATQLEENNRKHDAFIAAVIGELRPPITTLNRHLSLFDDHPAAQVEEVAATLRRDADRLQSIVDRLLTHSQQALAENRLSLHPLDINEVVADGVRHQRPLANRQGKKLHFLPALHLPPVAGDDSQLATALADVIAYAVDGAAGNRVEVRTFQDEAGQIRVSVRCDGNVPGRQSPQRNGHTDRRRYTEASAVPQRSPRLARVREIVRLHAGTVTTIDQPDGQRLIEVALPEVSKRRR